MKKTAWFLSSVMAAAAAFSMCSTAFSASAATSAFLKGDMNLDTDVDSLDAQIALSIYTDSVSGLESNAVTEENVQGDIDLDGFITVEDAESILMYYCQTLVDDKPLWAEYRTVIQEDGHSYRPIFVTDDPEVIANTYCHFCQSGLYIEVGCASGKPGETVTVPVYIAGISELCSFMLEIRHDLPLIPTDVTSNLPTYKQFGEEHNFFGYYLYPQGDNCCNIAWLDADDIFLDKGGYVLAEISYVIPEDAVEGTHYSVSVDPSYTEFSKSTSYGSGYQGSLKRRNEDGTVTDMCRRAYQYTALSGVVTVI